MVKKILSNLTFQVIISIVLGVSLGVISPDWGMSMKPISDTFFKVVKMLIPLIIFFSVVNGIGSIGNLKKLGTLGGKSLLYFEIVTTFALVIGLVLTNLIKPGSGIDFSQIQKGDISTIVTTKPQESIDWTEFLQHIIPSNIVKSFAEGDLVQVLFFAILFGMGLTQLGESGEGIIKSFDKFLHVLFNILGMLMKFAPLAAFAAMAFSIGKFGLASLIPLGKVMLTFYGTAILFIFIVLGGIARYTGFSIFKFLYYIREEFFIVLGTCSSETVLNRIMNKLENAGCSPSVTRFVIPTGYSFNLDGSTIYLSIATVFLAQAFNVDLSFQQQLTIVFILMVTSKGAAGVHGSAIVVLAGTLSALKIIPVEGVALLLGIDRFMSEARSTTNLIGNGVATLFIAKTENALDMNRLHEVLDGKNVD
jgi:aerobic C4-dicarboxylate transport protein